MRKVIAAAVILVAVSARAEQKNIQVLTGLTDTQLLDAMNLMRASLGVNCDACHVQKDNRLDFADDSKQTKRTARRMIDMVMRINEQDFNNEPEVSCNTCHRGSLQPVGLPALPQAIPPFPTPVRQRPANLPTRDAVVQKYAAAIGDASRLNLPRTFKGTRESSDGKSMTFEGQMANGNVHVTAETPAGAAEQVFTGTAGWIKTPQATRPMNDEGLATFRELSAAYEPLAPDAIPAKARVVNEQKIDGHDTFVVIAKLDDARRERLYFDTTSGLLVRRDVLKESPVGMIPVETDFDDYRDVGGTRFPFFARVSLVDPWDSATRRYSDVQLGAHVDASVFAPPKASAPAGR